jgi:hypothetical protein
MQHPAKPLANGDNLCLPDQLCRLFRRDPNGPEREDFFTDSLESGIAIPVNTSRLPRTSSAFLIPSTMLPVR